VTRLSILIPCVACGEALETTLVSVLQNRPADCEVLVIHQGPYDDPYDLKDEVRFVPVARGLGLAETINSGVEAAHGEVLHIVQCGVEVEEGWTRAALLHFEDPHVGAVSPLVLDADDREKVVTAGVAYRSSGTRRECEAGASIRSRKLTRTRIAGPSLLAAFYRRTALQTAGGFERAVGDMLADVDLALSLAALGDRSVVEPDSRVYSRGPLQASSTEFQAGRRAERLFLRHAPAIGWAKSLLLHPLLITADLLAGFRRPARWLRLIGRAVAWLEIGRHRRHHARLRATPRAAKTPAESKPENRRIDAAHATGAGRDASTSIRAPRNAA
jgi:GT2 family glycosyltransferase